MPISVTDKPGHRQRSQGRRRRRVAAGVAFEIRCILAIFGLWACGFQTSIQGPVRNGANVKRNLF